MKCCPHCNRPYPPDIYVGGPRGGRSRQKIYEFVKANPRGVTRRQIEDAVYGDYEDGGPLTAQSSIYVMIVKVNRVLKHHGFVIRAERGRGALYTLQELKPTRIVGTNRSWQTPRSAEGDGIPFNTERSIPILPVR